MTRLGGMTQKRSSQRFDSQEHSDKSFIKNETEFEDSDNEISEGDDVEKFNKRVKSVIIYF